MKFVVPLQFSVTFLLSDIMELDDKTVNMRNCKTIQKERDKEKKTIGRMKDKEHILVQFNFGKKNEMKKQMKEIS